MEGKFCFESGSKSKIELSCDCTFPNTYMCEFHKEKHKKSHHITSSSEASSSRNESTKLELLIFIAKEIAKRKKLKNKIVKSCQKKFSSYESSLEQSLSILESDTSELLNYFEKINKAQSSSDATQDSVLNLLGLQPNEAIKKAKSIFRENLKTSKYHKLSHSCDRETEEMIDLTFYIKINNKLDKLNERLKAVEAKENNNQKFESWKEEIRLTMENKANFQLEKIAAIESLVLKINEQIKLFWNLIAEIKTNELRAEKSQILEKNIDLEKEKAFRTTISSFEENWKSIYNSNETLLQAYQDILNAYSQKTSLYLTSNVEDKTNLLIYNTDLEIQYTKVLETPEPLNNGTCIVQLPNGKLFCFGRDPSSNISLTIDENYIVDFPPPGRPCSRSSAVYFKDSVYCFGGLSNGEFLNLSEKFDLGKNKWIQLKPLPESDYQCHCIVFNDEILISGYNSRKLLRYNIKSNTFGKKITYRFAAKMRKILINGERLYLIECRGKIYESDLWDEKVWKPVGLSPIIGCPNQVYCAYNRGVIYIGCRNEDKYYIFNQKLKEIYEPNRKNNLC